MTAQTALKAALRDIVGPAARGHGFKGSAPNWRRTNATGDWAVVNVQSSQYSSSEKVRCVINLAVAPAPWLASLRETHRSLPKAVRESLGLYRDRLHPAGTPPGYDAWWEIGDEREAVAAAHDMVEQLAVGGWPVLERMLDRQAMLEQLRSGELGMLKRENFKELFAHAEALLIAGQVQPRVGG
jgi:hypothetical protein